MKKTHLLLLLTAAALSQMSFAYLRDPMDALDLIKPEIESKVLSVSDKVVPISMHEHFLTEIHLNLKPGQHKYGEFADFVGTVTGKYRILSQLFPFSCSVSSRVAVVPFAMQPPENIILQEEGANQPQLIGKIKVICR